jgi:predicted amidohydrolase
MARVGACQTPEILGDVPGAVRVILDLAARADADLLVFPECFLQGYLVTDEHVRAYALRVDAPELAPLAAVRQTLVLGMIERDGDRYHNTALVLAGGRVLGRYRKRFLTAGESVFTAGAGATVFACAGVRFGINICYDAQFPEAAAAAAGGGAEVLLLPAQNMMPRERAVRWQERHNEIRRERVRETGMWLVSADVTGEREDRVGLGPTCVIDPGGRIVAQVPVGAVGVAIAEISSTAG